MAPGVGNGIADEENVDVAFFCQFDKTHRAGPTNPYLPEPVDAVVVPLLVVGPAREPPETEPKNQGDDQITRTRGMPCHYL